MRWDGNSVACMVQQSTQGRCDPDQAAIRTSLRWVAAYGCQAASQRSESTSARIACAPRSARQSDLRSYAGDRDRDGGRLADTHADGDRIVRGRAAATAVDHGGRGRSSTRSVRLPAHEPLTAACRARRRRGRRGRRSATRRARRPPRSSSTRSPPRRRHRLLLVQQLLDPAQHAAQGLRVGTGAAQRQRVLELGSDGIRYGLQRFRCISLRSAALQCARCAIN